MTSANTLTTAIAVRTPAYLPTVSPDAIEQALAIGDLSRMSAEVRTAYYIATCQSAGLNPMTRPFDVMKGDDGTYRLYPNKSCAEQLRAKHRISLRVTERRFDLDNALYIVTVQAFTPDGREDDAQGIVDTAGMKGKALANAILRAETKAKRRATLSLCGLGYEDSETVPGHPVRFDYQRGAIQEPPLTPEFPAAAPRLSLQENISDLYGDAREIPEFGSQMPVEAKNTPTPTQETPDAEQPAIDDPEANKLGIQINAAWQAFGLTDRQLNNFWERSSRRFSVPTTDHIRVADLATMLRETQAWIAKQPRKPTSAPEPTDWRTALGNAAIKTQDPGLLEETWTVLNDDDTPAAVGKALLQRVLAATGAVETEA